VDSIMNAAIQFAGSSHKLKKPYSNFICTFRFFLKPSHFQEKSDRFRVACIFVSGCGRGFLILGLVVVVVLFLVFRLGVVFAGPAKFAAVGRERGKHHINASTHHFWLGFHSGHGGEIGFHPLHKGVTKFLVSHFTSAKLKLGLHLVAFIEKFLGPADLRHVIVIVDIDPEFDFLEFAGGGFLVFFLLGDFVTVFTEIDDAADRGNGIGSDFDEVEAFLLSAFDGVGELKDAKLLVGGCHDDAHFSSAYAAIDTGWLLYGAISLENDRRLRR
jgi:hypothetical protein